MLFKLLYSCKQSSKGNNESGKFVAAEKPYMHRCIMCTHDTSEDFSLRCICFGDRLSVTVRRTEEV